MSARERRSPSGPKTGWVRHPLEPGRRRTPAGFGESRLSSSTSRGGWYALSCCPAARVAASGMLVHLHPGWHVPGGKLLQRGKRLRRATTQARRRANWDCRESYRSTRALPKFCATNAGEREVRLASCGVNVWPQAVTRHDAFNSRLHLKHPPWRTALPRADGLDRHADSPAERSRTSCSPNGVL